jgi:hypothetical protein
MPMRRFLSVAYRAITLLGEEPNNSRLQLACTSMEPKTKFSRPDTTRGTIYSDRKGFMFD